MIILAHDGSLYGDWVARYALQFATLEGDRKLLVLHVRDGKISDEVVSSRLSQLQTDCQQLGVDVIQELLPLTTSVYRSLAQAIPPEPDALLVCGTRVKPRRRAFLRGSVAELLLRGHHCPVLALRVVQPGLLGSPQNLLLPMTGQLGGFNQIWPILQRLMPRLNRVHLFRALYVHHLRHAHLSEKREQELIAIGRTYLENIALELKTNLSGESTRIETQVTMASDWPNAVLVQASRLKVQMLLTGVSERSLAHKVLLGDDTERLLLQSPCDVGVYRGP